MTSSHMTAHMQMAETLMREGQYEAAYHELEAAAQRFMTYKEQMAKSIDSSIAHLSTLGDKTMPPHPVALPLVQLRRKLTA